MVPQLDIGHCLLKTDYTIIRDRVQIVANLLEEETGVWYVNLVQQLFIARDANAILNMPQAIIDVEDFWAWEAEKNGVFSFKPAYRLLKRQGSPPPAAFGAANGGRDQRFRRRR